MTEQDPTASARLSTAVEDYLKAIYKLQQHGEAVATGAIARALDISPASATNMAKRLAEMRLVHYESYQGVTLTEAGARIALEVIRHHRLLELYLKEVMDYSWEQLHEEAERLEHHISEAFESKLDELLGYPTHDPHGHPIPTREGTVDEMASHVLADVEAGQRATISHLNDDDPALLHHLEERGLLPGADLTVVDREPFDGPMTVRIDGQEQLVGQVVARSVFVQPVA
ncbi:MAG: metal-dependent transcriptional regulator [Bacteroidetes bacterium]|jgi:DtxR family Mn-dependent transcriptional regulator|nr:metal-dependent transcriptional regulator [Bacteroidota bacterium]